MSVAGLGGGAQCDGQVEFRTASQRGRGGGDGERSGSRRGRGREEGGGVHPDRKQQRETLIIERNAPLKNMLHYK